MCLLFGRTDARCLGSILYFYTWHHTIHFNIHFCIAWIVVVSYVCDAVRTLYTFFLRFSSSPQLLLLLMLLALPKRRGWIGAETSGGMSAKWGEDCYFNVSRGCVCFKQSHKHQGSNGKHTIKPATGTSRILSNITFCAVVNGACDGL